MINTPKSLLNTPFLRHLIFWIVIFLYFTLSANMLYYSGYKQLFETHAVIVGIQSLVAYTCVDFLVPRFLNKKQTFLFCFFLVLLLISVYVVYITFRVYYLDVNYAEYYTPIAKEYIQLSFIDRLLDYRVIMSKFIKFLTPAALLLMVRFYKNQQKYLKLSEQKKIAELTALKNQLNPHFLFNTLNNLYSLAIKKSDKTAEVIERLSDILDYILYRCNSTYVPLQNEIELIENYLGLEKVRYNKRVHISFENKVDKAVKIAPLLLLTFIENAFKHGVGQELNKATIKISIELEKNHILFSIYNTKPFVSEKKEIEKEGIGLHNINQQLDLLYPNSNSIEIEDLPESYSLVLKLKQK